MKRILVLVLTITVVLSLVACGNQDSAATEPGSASVSQNAPQETSDVPANGFDTSTPTVSPSGNLIIDPENGEDSVVPSMETEASAEPESSDEAIPEMTNEELATILLEQPMYVESTRYIVQDDRFKALYPDMLQAIIRNNSGTDIKNVVIAFVAWDENGFPVKIVGKYDFSGGSYVKLCNYSDVNMLDGSTYGQDSGMALDSDTDNIATFKAIIVSYDDFDGNTWENPYYSTWLEMYEDKKLS